MFRRFIPVARTARAFGIRLQSTSKPDQFDYGMLENKTVMLEERMADIKRSMESNYNSHKSEIAGLKSKLDVVNNSLMINSILFIGVVASTLSFTNYSRNK